MPPLPFYHSVSIVHPDNPPNSLNTPNDTLYSGTAPLDYVILRHILYPHPPPSYGYITHISHQPTPTAASPPPHPRIPRTYPTHIPHPRPLYRLNISPASNTASSHGMSNTIDTQARMSSEK